MLHRFLTESARRSSLEHQPISRTRENFQLAVTPLCCARRAAWPPHGSGRPGPLPPPRPSLLASIGPRSTASATRGSGTGRRRGPHGFFDSLRSAPLNPCSTERPRHGLPRRGQRRQRRRSPPVAPPAQRAELRRAWNPLLWSLRSKPSHETDMHSSDQLPLSCNTVYLPSDSPGRS